MESPLFAPSEEGGGGDGGGGEGGARMDGRKRWPPNAWSRRSTADDVYFFHGSVNANGLFE